jgi:hypothetical protein
MLYECKNILKARLKRLSREMNLRQTVEESTIDIKQNLSIFKFLQNGY